MVRPDRVHHGCSVSLEYHLEALRVEEVPLEVLFEDVHLAPRGMRNEAWPRQNWKYTNGTAGPVNPISSTESSSSAHTAP